MKDFRNDLQKKFAEQEIKEAQEQMQYKSVSAQDDVRKCEKFLREIERFAIISDYHSDFYSVFQGFWAGNVECEVTLWEYIDGQLYADYIGWIDIYNGSEQDFEEYTAEDKTPFALGFNGAVKPKSNDIMRIVAENGHPEVIFEAGNEYIRCLPMVAGLDADTVKYCAQLFAKKWAGKDIPLEHIFPGEWKIEKNMPNNEVKALNEIVKSFIEYNPEVAQKIGISHDDIQEQMQKEMDEFKENVIDKLVDENGCVTMRIGEDDEDFKMQVKNPDKNSENV